MFAIPSTPAAMWPPHGYRSFLSLKSVEPLLCQIRLGTGSAEFLSGAFVTVHHEQEM